MQFQIGGRCGLGWSQVACVTTSVNPQIPPSPQWHLQFRVSLFYSLYNKMVLYIQAYKYGQLYSSEKPRPTEAVAARWVYRVQKGEILLFNGKNNTIATE